MSATAIDRHHHRFGIHERMPSGSAISQVLSNTFLWKGAQCSEDVAHPGPYYYCMRCDEMFCGDCWFKIKKHRMSEPEHEQTIPKDAIVVHSTLKVRLDEWPLLGDAIKQFRAQEPSRIDYNSEWFGVRRKNEAGDYSLVEGHAYNLVAEFLKTSKSDVYPHLVSFVGETGSGKSTLIALLSEFSDPSSPHYFKTPAVRDSGSYQSTSSNVHLYTDPQTYLDENPILYADCEGIDGDEIPTEMENPLAGASASNDSPSHASQTFELGSYDIIWSKMPRNTGAWTRKEITNILFPRILYIFSDVVVFPFSRIRLSDTIFQLVKWGHDAMVRSYNKPVLPSVIIVFLNRDDQVDPREYDLSAARKSFFEGLQDVSRDKALRPYIEHLKIYGRHVVVSAEHLLKCYYSSVSVVHLPSSQRPTTIRLQIEKLHDRISQACLESQKRREAAWMKWNATTLSLFVRKAFTHFASKYETPFNFSDAWVDAENFSTNLGWSIFNLARMAREHRGLSRAGSDLWVEISDFVASCLFLNCVREKQTDYKVTEKFLKQYDEAIKQYWTKFWPCYYRLETPDGYQQCANAPCGHPHHQRGKAIERSDHLVSRSLLKLQRDFKHMVIVNFDRLKSSFKQLSDDPERLLWASETHLNTTRSFYKSMGGIDKLVSHFPCLVCLNGAPEHSLPCGHVICRACAKAAGDSTPGRFVTLQECPLHYHRKEDWPQGLAEYDELSKENPLADVYGPRTVSRGWWNWKR